MVFHYYLKEDVDVAHYTTTNTFLTWKSKFSNCIVFSLKMLLFKQMKVKGDCSCLYQAIASQIMSFCLNNVGLIDFSLERGMKKQATCEVVNDFKQLIFQKDSDLLKKNRGI